MRRIIKKPPAAFAGGGLCAALLLNPVRQASLPAPRLGPLIRIAGMGTTARITGRSFALALTVCMNVEESRAEARGARQESRVRAAGQSHLDRCREGANQIAENICQERPACNRVFTHFPKHIPFISCWHFKCDCPGCGQGWRRALQQGASANTPAIDSMPSRGAGESPLLRK